MTKAELENEYQRIMKTIEYAAEEERKNPGPGWDPVRKILQQAHEDILERMKGLVD